MPCSQTKIIATWLLFSYSLTCCGRDMSIKSVEVPGATIANFKQSGGQHDHAIGPAQVPCRGRWPGDCAACLCSLHSLTLRLEGPIGLPTPASRVHVHHNRLLVVREHGSQREALLPAVPLSACAFAHLHVHLWWQHITQLVEQPSPDGWSKLGAGWLARQLHEQAKAETSAGVCISELPVRCTHEQQWPSVGKCSRGRKTMSQTGFLH